MANDNKDNPKRLVTRRQAVVGGVAAAATLAGIGAIDATAKGRSPGGRRKDEKMDNKRTEPHSGRMPLAYVPHGGGPFSYVDMGAPANEVEPMVDYWRSVGTAPRTKPKALLVVSAHWEESVPTVMSSPKPPMLFDYYGFPPASYEITWPAPGDPKLAARVRALLGEAGFETADDDARGFDHGTYIPFKRSFPDADIPTIQLSLKKGLDPLEHIKMGRALAPLRDEGVYILGSGMSYHNMRGFGRADSRVEADRFDAWLQETAKLDAEQRDGRLVEWTSAPSARAVHPREEHLMPLMVISGAAGADRGTIPYSNNVFGVRVSAVQFG